MDKKDLFLIVDGHSLAFRAYFAFPETLTLKSGLPVNAIYGFVSLLFNAIDRYNPTYLCVCFDRKEPTFRHVQYEGYKAHRPSAPEPFIVQMQHLRTLLTHIGIPTMDKAGFEADDLMGTLSHSGEAKGLDVRVMTGDHDALQLVTDSVWVVMNKKSEFLEYNPKEVEVLYGIRPDQMVDYKALRGDTSDNIPGVPGIGEKTAIQLLTKYGDLAGVYAHIDEVMPLGMRAKLQAGGHMAELSLFLATINCAVELDYSWDLLKYLPDWPTILAAFTSYEFNRLVQKYQTKLSVPLAVPKAQGGEIPFTVLSLAELETHRVLLLKGFSLAISPDDAFHVGVAVSGEPGWLIPDNDAFWAFMAPLLADVAIPKWLFDAKSLFQRLKSVSELQGLAFDAQVGGYVLGGQQEGLEFLMGHVTGEYETAGINAGQLAWLVAGAVPSMTEEMHRWTMDALFYEMELPLIPVLVMMERTGITVDLKALEVLRERFQTQLTKVKQDCVFQAGMDFNVSSPKQLSEVLFDHLKLPVFKKTKTGRSTDSSVLEKLIPHHPIAKLLLTFRQLEKLLSTYVNSLPSLVNPVTGRVHTTYNQMGAATGRLSSTNPNLQNIPIRTPEGLDIRGAFVPSAPDRVLLSADYSQIELRILAHMCQDAHMIATFKRGEDIHSSTAATVFEVPLAEVTKEQRYSAKAVNFGIIYGMSSFGLSENLSIPPAEAKIFIERYFETFPTIKTFIASTIELAKSTGYVTTEFGRVRAIPELKASSFVQRQFGERAAVNTRIQGTAADVIKLAMVTIAKTMEKKFPDARLILQVHDELVFDVPESQAEALGEWVRVQMKDVVSWSVPLDVDVAWGKNWKEISI